MNQDAKDIAVAEAEKKAVEASALAKRLAEEARQAKVAEKIARNEARQAKDKAKREAEEARSREKEEARQAKDKAKWEAEEASAREANESRQATVRAEKQTDESERPGEAEETQVEDLFEGTVVISIAAPSTHKQVSQLGQHLARVKGLKVLCIGCSVGAGMRITVRTDGPTALLDILGRAPFVVRRFKTKKGIEIGLKAPE
ncbi:MAG TPA: hypothetical protein VJL08_03355 [Dehalococcoidia bacterium]|nr:hypothetical protein [Dehalococcoidia bacterium]